MSQKEIIYRVKRIDGNLAKITVSNKMMKDIVCTNMCIIRRTAKIAQKSMASFLGISQQEYSRYERGKVCPSLKILASFALFFSISLDSLFGFIDIDLKLRGGKSCDYEF